MNFNNIDKMYVEQGKSLTGNNAISQTMKWVGLALLCATAGAGLFQMISPEWVMTHRWTVLGGSFAVLLASFGVLWMIHRAKNESTAVLGLMLFGSMMGLTTGPLVMCMLMKAHGAVMVMQALGLTALATGGLSVYAAHTKKDWSTMGGMLVAGLCVLIGLGLVNIFIQSSVLAMTLSAMGALIFSAFLVVDVQQAIREPQPSVMMAIHIFLDILNLFTSFLQLLNMLQDD